MNDQHIHITGQKNTGKSQTGLTIEQLAERIRNLEEEVDGVEPPKSEEMQKIEELEDKIDRLLTEDRTSFQVSEDFVKQEQDNETEAEEDTYECQYCGKEYSMHEYFKRHLEDCTERQPSGSYMLESEDTEPYPVNYEETTSAEKEQAIKQAIKDSEEPLTYYQIAEKAFGEEVDSKNKIYKYISDATGRSQNLKKQSVNGKKYEVKYEPEGTEEEHADDLPNSQGRCKHCGEVFDNRGLAQHQPGCNGEIKPEMETDIDGASDAEEVTSELGDTKLDIIKQLNNYRHKSSGMVALAIPDVTQDNTQYHLRQLKEQGLVESKRGQGSRLTDKGQEVKEAAETQASDTEEGIIGPDELDIDERTQKILEVLEEADSSLRRKDIIRRVFQIPEDQSIESRGLRYTRTEGAMKQLRKKDIITKDSERSSYSKAYYHLTSDAPDQTTEEEEERDEDDSGSDVSEDMDWEDVKKSAGVRDEDVDVVKLTFDKLVNRNDKDEISYHDFDQHYTGEEKPLRMFQKLFHNPKLLEGIKQRTLPGKDLKWKKRGEGKYGTGARNWVIIVEH